MVLALAVGAEPSGMAAKRASRTRLFGDDELPPFPNVFETSLGEELALNGQPIRASYFMTTRGCDQVRDFYLNAFSEQSLSVTVLRSKECWSLVAANPLEATTRVVVAQTRPGGTDVFCSVLPASVTPVQLRPGADPDIPFDVDSTGAVDVASGGSSGGRVVVYQELAPQGEVESRVDRGMTARGWVTSSRNEAGAAAVRRYQRGGGKATASFHPAPHGKSLTGVVLILEGNQS